MENSTLDFPAATSLVDTSSSGNKKTSDDKETNFCHRCGENGHFAVACTNPDNQTKVIHWLICSPKRSVQAAQLKREKESCSGVCSPKTSAVKTLTINGLPKGLVGRYSLVLVKMRPLLDTWFTAHCYL